MFGHNKEEEVEKKYAIVTGASSGLGEAMVMSLLEKEYTVFGFSRSGLAIEDENYIDIECDIRVEEQVEKAFSIIEKETEGVDLLINNAGICEMSPVGETSSEEFTNHLETNTLGTFHVLKHYENFIYEGDSHVINILSTAAKYTYANVSAYCASKFALKGLIEATQLEWSKYDVKFTNMYPGAIETPLWEKLDMQFSKAKMLSLEEFSYVFNMVVDSPASIRFDDLTFLHRQGLLK
jgi:NAD(P)-dependent dehydrogenase (short-subunit alcohol dehydrogenase family)